MTRPSPDAYGDSAGTSFSLSGSLSASTTDGWSDSVQRRPLLHPDEIGRFLARIDDRAHLPPRCRYHLHPHQAGWRRRLRSCCKRSSAKTARPPFCRRRHPGSSRIRRRRPSNPLPRAVAYRAQTKGKVERFIHFLRHSFWVPLDSRLRPLGLKVDAATANVEVRKWLRDTANQRIHGTTGRIPAELLCEEQGTLLPLAAL